MQDLKDCFWVYTQIELLEESIGQWQTRARRYAACSLPADASRSSRAESCALQLELLERDWRRQVRKYSRLTRRVEAAIAALPCNQAAVMRMRYMNGLAWRVIARRMHYDESWCRRLERGALRALGLR